LREKDYNKEIALVFKTEIVLINSAGIAAQTYTKTHLADSHNLQKVFDVKFMDSYCGSKYILPCRLP
jgi:hypothetical protein